VGVAGKEALKNEDKMLRSVAFGAALCAVIGHFYVWSGAVLAIGGVPFVLSKPQDLEAQRREALSRYVSGACLGSVLVNSQLCKDLKASLTAQADLGLRAFPYHAKTRLDQAELAYYLRQDFRLMNQEMALSARLSGQNRLRAAERYVFGFTVLPRLSPENQQLRQRDYQLASGKQSYAQ
jgi:hypothetical protein